MTILTQDQAKYLEENYKKFGDNKLAKALKKEKPWVRNILSELQLVRNKEDIDFIHKHKKLKPPKFIEHSSEPYVLGIKKVSKRAFLWLFLTFLIPCILYSTTISSYPTGKNGVELSICAYGLGLPEYIVCPFYLILGQLLSIAHQNSFALLLNLSSVLFGAIACFTMAHIIYRLSQSILVSLFLSLMLAFSFYVWKYSISTSPEIFSFSFLLISIYFAICWNENLEEKYLTYMVLTLLTSVMFSFSYSIFFPAFLIFVLSGKRQRSSFLKLFPAIALLSLIFSSILIFLFVVSRNSIVYTKVSLKTGNDLAHYIFTSYFYFIDQIDLKMHLQMHKQILPHIQAAFQYPFYSFLGIAIVFSLYKSFSFLWRTRRPLFLLFLLLFSLSLLSPLVLSGLILLLIFQGVFQFIDECKSFKLYTLPFIVLPLLLFGQLSSHRISYKKLGFIGQYYKSISQTLDSPKALILPHNDTTLFYMLYDKITQNKSFRIVNIYGQDNELYSIFSDKKKLLAALRKKYSFRTLFTTNFIAEAGNYHQKRVGFFYVLRPIIYGQKNFTNKPVLPEPPFSFLHLSEKEKDFLSLCHFRKAEELLEEKQAEQALYHLRKVNKKKKNIRSLLLYHAKKLSLERKYDYAIEYYEMIPAPDVQIYLSMARIFKIKKQYVYAKKYYVKALLLQPESFNALAEIARIYEEEKRYDKAINIYEKLIRKYPNVSYIYKALAKILYKKPETRERAKKLFEKAKVLAKKEAKKKKQLEQYIKPHARKKPTMTNFPKVNIPKVNIPKIPTPKLPK